MTKPRNSRKTKTRDPPVAVQDALRREVGYRCPEDRCSSPFLSFHHFDPPWREEQHHRPDGMIAMCPEHCGPADGGHYTKRRLRELKTKTPTPEFEHPFPWQPEAITFMLGNKVIVGPAPRFCLWERAVLGVSPTTLPSGGRILALDADIRSLLGESLISISSNVVRFKTGSDIEFRTKTRAGELQVRHDSGAWFKLEIDYLSREGFARRMREAQLDDKHLSTGLAFAEETAIDSDGRYPVVRLTGDFFAPGIEVELRERRGALRIQGFLKTGGTQGSVVSGKFSIRPNVNGLIAFELSGGADDPRLLTPEEIYAPPQAHPRLRRNRKSTTR